MSMFFLVLLDDLFVMALTTGVPSGVASLGNTEATIANEGEKPSKWPALENGYR